MYTLPQPHKCDKCGHEMQYSQDDMHPSPVVGNTVTCPKCWEEWLRVNIGTLRCTVDWNAHLRKAPTNG